MRKIKDERLVKLNLENIRIVYFVQTIGIIAILAYDLITKGVDGMRENPLWLLFIITAIVSTYLSMNISVDYASNTKSIKKSLLNSISILLLISVVVGIGVYIVEKSMINGILIGGLILICGIPPILYVNHLRKNRNEFYE